MRTVKSVQEAIDAVAQGSVAVYRDTYLDQISPDYHILETDKEVEEFETLVQTVESEKVDTITALNQLEVFVGQPCETSFLVAIYKNGQWAREPEELLDEEFDLQQWEEDQGWFEAQREHFERMEYPAPVVADEPWRDEVVNLAIEIAAVEGRAPEEADFNTAMLQLHDQVPPKELKMLQRDLKKIEEGR